MNVAITGAAGYVGQRACQVLDPAIGLDLRYGDDCRDEAYMLEVARDVDAVVHLAAVSGIDACERDRAAAVRENVEATAAVARACAEYNTRLVFASSQAVGGGSFYGQTKRWGVELLRALPVGATVLTFPNIYGRYEADGKTVRKGTVVDLFVDRALAGRPLPVHRPGTQVRNFIHVDDIVAAIRRALVNWPCETPIYGPDTVSVNELAAMVAGRANVAAELVEPDRDGVFADIDVDYQPQRDRLGFTPERSLSGYLDEVL